MTNFFYRNLKKHYPTVESAKGVWIRDTDGKEYLDGCSGAVASNIGHGVSEVNEAIQDQLSKVAFAHTSQFVSEPALALAEHIATLRAQSHALIAGTKVTPSPSKERVYLTSGGSEAIETAIKMARGYFVEIGQPKRRYLLTRWQSYHGSTLGAMNATGHPARRKPYLPILYPELGHDELSLLVDPLGPQAKLVDRTHIETPYPYRCHCENSGVCASSECALSLANELEKALERLGSENVMAFMAAPIVGATLGAVTPQAGNVYWKRIREICTAHGVLLISDEVMTGLGRVGANFGTDIYGVESDISVLGKGLSAGYVPLGAVAASEKVAAGFENGSGVFEHGFTYSGHPTSAAGGLAVLRYIQKHNLTEKVANAQQSFFERLDALRSFDFVGDIRGKGYMSGIEFVKDRTTKAPFEPSMRVSAEIAKTAFANGLLVYPGSGFLPGAAGDHIMITPPLTITDSEMDELFNRLTTTLKQFARSPQIKSLLTR